MKNGHEWATPGYEDEVKRWSQIVRKFRKLMGWTQGKLAREIGVTYTSVNKYENQRALPARFVRGAIKELFKKIFRNLELEDITEMDELELKKLFFQETEKKLSKPMIIIRRRSPEFAQQMQKGLKRR